VYQQADQPTRDAMDLAHLAGQRPGDSLRMREQDIVDGALQVRQGKTGAPVRVRVIGKLAEVIDRIMARKATLKVRSFALVVNERGQPLSPRRSTTASARRARPPASARWTSSSATCARRLPPRSRTRAAWTRRRTCSGTPTGA
jgi:integrase